MDRIELISKDLRKPPCFFPLIESFLVVVFEHALKNGIVRARCPCKNCKNDVYPGRKKIREHLILLGFQTRYTSWVWHGELDSDFPEDLIGKEIDDSYMNADFEEMVENVTREFHGKPKVLQALYNDSKTVLYTCLRHLALSATLRIMNLKAKYGWTEKGMTRTLELFRELLPKGNLLLNRSYASKRILCPMGMELEEIHACPNDCMLYKGVKDKDLKCFWICGESQYKLKWGGIEVVEEANLTMKKKPGKVLWYLLIIPRPKKLFSSKEGAKLFRWHAERDRPADGVICHTSDGEQWKEIDSMYPEFGAEPRHLRLGLSTGGMNPFGNMSSSHSSWSAVMVIYNLPS